MATKVNRAERAYQKALRGLPRKELLRFVDAVTAILYWEVETSGERWNPQKEWDGDTLSMIDEQLPASVKKAIGAR